MARLVADLLGDDVHLEPTPRQNPITHRHFDVTQALKAFPSFRFTPIEEAMAAVVAGVVGPAVERVG